MSITTPSRPPASPDPPATLDDALVVALETVLPHYHRVMRRALADLAGVSADD